MLIRKPLFVAAIAAALAGGTAQAQSYLMAGSEPVRSAYGDYWRTGYSAGEEKKKPEPAIATYSAEVLFAFDNDVLSAEARKQLDELAQKLSAVEVEKVVAVGHADGVGPETYNRQLSARRAKAVGDYLAGKGVPAERLQLVAMGQHETLASGACELREPAGRRHAELIDCLQPDRRVEIELVGRQK